MQINGNKIQEQIRQFCKEKLTYLRSNHFINYFEYVFGRFGMLLKWFKIVCILLNRFKPVLFRAQIQEFKVHAL